MDQSRFGLNTKLRCVWITKCFRPEVRRQAQYTWDYLYIALGVDGVDGVAGSLKLDTLEC